MADVDGGDINDDMAKWEQRHPPSSFFKGRPGTWDTVRKNYARWNAELSKIEKAAGEIEVRLLNEAADKGAVPLASVIEAVQALKLEIHAAVKAEGRRSFRSGFFVNALFFLLGLLIAWLTKSL